MKPESPREGAFFLIRHKLGISTIAEKLIETQSNTYLLFITPLQLEITHKTPQFYALNSTTSESDNATSNTCARTRMHHSAQPRIPFGTDSAHKNRSAVNKYFLLFCNCIPVSILTSDVALRRLDNATEIPRGIALQKGIDRRRSGNLDGNADAPHRSRDPSGITHPDLAGTGNGASSVASADPARPGSLIQPPVSRGLFTLAAAAFARTRPQRTPCRHGHESAPRHAAPDRPHAPAAHR